MGKRFVIASMLLALSFSTTWGQEKGTSTTLRLCGENGSNPHYHLGDQVFYYQPGSKAFGSSPDANYTYDPATKTYRLKGSTTGETISLPVIESTVTSAPSSASPAATTNATNNGETRVVAYHSGTAAAQAAQPAVATENYASSMAWQMLQRNNEIRARSGRSPHTLSDRLNMAAQDHANYMARTGSFSHYSNGGPSGRASRYGVGSGVRENIAMGQSSVSSVFGSWTASSGHYTNMMSGTTAAGFGYATDSAGRPYWVAVYGDE